MGKNSNAAGSENQILFATGNNGKMKEIKRILEDLGMEICSIDRKSVV